MNKVEIEIDIEDEQLRNTLYTNLDVETQATKTDRGFASAEINGSKLIITIEAQDYVAARAITNSMMRLLQASVDVAESITIKRQEE